MKRGADIRLARLEFKTGLEKLKGLKQGIRKSGANLSMTSLEIFERLRLIEIFIEDGLKELED